MNHRYRYAVTLVSSFVLASCGAEEPQAESNEPAPAPAAVQADGPALSDHAWRLAAIDMMDGEDFEPAAGSEPTVVFSEEANPTGSRLMNGSTGCNDFNATYDAGRGGRLAISSATMTRMACADDAMRLEQFFMIGLESARTYTIDDAGLAIDFGGGVLHFVADDAGA